MKGGLRAAIPLFFSSPTAAAGRLSPSPSPSIVLRRSPLSPLHRFFSTITDVPPPAPVSTGAPATRDYSPSPSSMSSMEQQFEDFRVQLEDSRNVRGRIRAVVFEMESAVGLMHSCLLLVHHTLPNADVLEKARVQIEVLKRLFVKLAEIHCECPGEYYRFHGDWRSEAHKAVSLVAFLHWLETGNLLVHAEAEKTLGLDNSEFGLDVEDYLIGLCLISNELPRYVVNQVTAGDYDCPRKVLRFLNDLHAAFRILNLRNDFLRKKFDGMKYDLRRVEEVYDDVKVRGLGSNDSAQEQTTQA